MLWNSWEHEAATVGGGIVGGTIVVAGGYDEKAFAFVARYLLNLQRLSAPSVYESA